VQLSLFATASLLGLALLFGRLPKDDASGEHKLNLGPGARGTHERELACDVATLTAHLSDSLQPSIPFREEDAQLRPRTGSPLDCQFFHIQRAFILWLGRTQ